MSNRIYGIKDLASEKTYDDPNMTFAIVTEEYAESTVSRKIPTWLSAIASALNWLVYLYDIYRRYSD